MNGTKLTGKIGHINKEYLEAFELVKRTCELYIKSASNLIGTDIIGNKINEALSTIQNRLEAIDNSKPSDALECLERLKSLHRIAVVDKRGRITREELNNKELYSTINHALLQAERDKKFREICIKKHISIWRFRNIVFGYEQKQNGNFVNDTYEYYKEHFGYYHEGFEFELLTEEEFNFIKEMVK